VKNELVTGEIFRIRHSKDPKFPLGSNVVGSSDLSEGVVVTSRGRDTVRATWHVVRYMRWPTASGPILSSWAIFHENTSPLKDGARSMAKVWLSVHRLLASG
jgi:hypothetical protein